MWTASRGSWSSSWPKWSARDGEGLAEAIAQQRQPLDRLVAEHEPDLAIADLASPAAHRRGGDLLFEEAIGDVDAVESKGCHVEEERPTARRAGYRKPVELTKGYGFIEKVTVLRATLGMQGFDPRRVAPITWRDR